MSEVSGESQADGSLSLLWSLKEVTDFHAFLNMGNLFFTRNPKATKHATPSSF